jgi:hypothetical protein
MITVTLTEKEILETPNAYELGEIVHDRYWSQKKEEDLRARILKENQPEIPLPEYDRCVTCGAESPYTQGHHVDYRIGYIEGAGQGCFQPSECSK